MPEVTLTGDVSVWCGQCRMGLCKYSEGGDGEITVDPCPNCMKEKYEEGYEDGRATCDDS